ncbi:hypothetical protein D3C73_1482120 [compost metagenome]
MKNSLIELTFLHIRSEAYICDFTAHQKTDRIHDMNKIIINESTSVIRRELAVFLQHYKPSFILFLHRCNHWCITAVKADHKNYTLLFS